MIVEDEIRLALDLKAELNNMGYEGCKYVTNGIDAIKNVEQVKPDIVLMDIILEGEMNGIEAAREIYSRQKTPIIFIARCIDEGAKNLAEKFVGNVEFLLKPVKSEDLQLAIERVLQRKYEENKMADQKRKEV